MKPRFTGIIGTMLMAPTLFCGTILVSPATRNATVGETTSFDIDVRSIGDLFAWQFDVEFNPSALSALNTTEGSFLASGGTTFFVSGTADNVSGTILSIANTLLGAIAGVSGDGTLATIQFSVLSAGSSTISLRNVTLLDSSLNAITATVSGGVVVGTDSSDILEPSSWVLTVLGGTFLAVCRRVSGSPPVRQRSPVRPAIVIART